MSTTEQGSKTKVNLLDGLELLTVKQQRAAFPEHFHDTFCISLVRQGIETIQLPEGLFHSEQGHISLTHPGEIHANPLADQDARLSFETLYLSQEVMDFFTGQKGTYFPNRQLLDPALVQSFDRLHKAMEEKGGLEIEAELGRFIGGLKPWSQAGAALRLPSLAPETAEVLLYIDAHLTHKISLEMLARIGNMDKYNFAKHFRAHLGMSPINFVLMKKVFAAKKQIQRDTDLTALAYHFDFADQAHFSRTFKRFVGLSPNSYKKGLTP